MEITIFTLPVCPNCEELKQELKTRNIIFKERNLEDSNVYTDLLLDCVTLTEAPIIKIDEQYYNMATAKELLL
jgi:glutaredoxin